MGREKEGKKERKKRESIIILITSPFSTSMTVTVESSKPQTKSCFVYVLYDI